MTSSEENTEWTNNSVSYALLRQCIFFAEKIPTQSAVGALLCAAVGNHFFIFCGRCADIFSEKLRKIAVIIKSGCCGYRRNRFILQKFFRFFYLILVQKRTEICTEIFPEQPAEMALIIRKRFRCFIRCYRLGIVILNKFKHFLGKNIVFIENRLYKPVRNRREKYKQIALK